jgi:prepilin-type N-terminal cleavage/methylation domain-containing protein
MVTRFCRNQKGFTLVEVIVVAVIVAVLAAVAIPLYMGYIKDSRIDVGNNVAGTISSACGASTQQGLVAGAAPFAAGTFVSPDHPAAPLTITFTGQNTANNVITIPNSYTAIITDGAPGTPQGVPGTVECFYSAYLTGSGKMFTYKQ